MSEIFRPAVRFVIINDKNQILLVRHKTYWAIPWGGVDFWESLADALCRESLEEMNVRAELDEIIFIQDFLWDTPDMKSHALEYFCSIKNNGDFKNVLEDCKQASHFFEYEEISWFDINNFPEEFMPLAFPKIVHEYVKNNQNFKTKYISWIK